MKKILIGALSLLMLASCDCENCDNTDCPKSGASSRYKKVATTGIMVSSPLGPATLTEVEYNGHVYVVTRGTESVSTLHSPNCPCLKKQTSNWDF